MRVGIGLPSAVPGATATSIGSWAAAAEQAGFQLLGATDRLIYHSLDPLVTLSVAAAHTSTIELATAAVNIGYRSNPAVVASQIAALDQLSGGRFTAGVAMGAWAEDFAAGEVEMVQRGARFEKALAQMRSYWNGELTGSAGPVPALPAGRPALLLAGLVPAGMARAAALSDGWLAPAFSRELLLAGVQVVTGEWERLERAGRPRFLAVRYFQLGDGAQQSAESYTENYYGPYLYPQVRPDLLTDPEHLRNEVAAIAAAGVHDLILLPCTHAADQIDLLAEALGSEWLGNGSTASQLSA